MFESFKHRYGCRFDQRTIGEDLRSCKSARKSLLEKVEPRIRDSFINMDSPELYNVFHFFERCEEDRYVVFVSF